jgi:hypothetical protein
VLGEGLARRPLSAEGRHLGRPGSRSLCRQLVLRRRGLEVFELQLELIEQPGTAFGALAELLAPELLDLQLQMDDQRLVVGCPGSQACRFGSYGGSVRARHGQFLVARQQQSLQARHIVRQGIHRGHRHQEDHKAGRL